jgi:hypothetical protein
MLGITTKDSLLGQQLSEEQLTTVVILLVSPKIFDELPGLLAQRVIPKLF